MRDIPDIPGVDKLVAALGDWPSFHDSEVHCLTMRRDRGVVELVIHVWRALGSADSRGHFTRDRHHLVVLQCQGCDSIEAIGFNEQNVIFDLTLHRELTAGKTDGGPWHLKISTSYGLALELRARDVAIRAIEPCDSHGTTAHTT